MRSFPKLGSLIKPLIAGQPRQYIEKQLQNYANGSRRTPATEAMAKAALYSAFSCIAMIGIFHAKFFLLNGFPYQIL